MDMIPKAYQMRVNTRDLRDLTRARLRLTQKATSCINNIDRILEKFNIAPPLRFEFLKLEQKIVSLDYSDFYKLQINCYFAQYLLIEKQILELEKIIEPIFVQNDDILRLRTIPGYGHILSTSIYLEIGDINRFAEERKLFPIPE